jgi:hypothetical protein
MFENRGMNVKPNNSFRIIILGSGFAGVKVLKRLACIVILYHYGHPNNPTNCISYYLVT